MRRPVRGMSSTRNTLNGAAWPTGRSRCGRRAFGKTYQVRSGRCLPCATSRLPTVACAVIGTRTDLSGRVSCRADIGRPLHRAFDPVSGPIRAPLWVAARVRAEHESVPSHMLEEAWLAGPGDLVAGCPAGSGRADRSGQVAEPPPRWPDDGDRRPAFHPDEQLTHGNSGTSNRAPTGGRRRPALRPTPQRREPS